MNQVARAKQVKWAREILKSAGLRQTEARVAVLTILFSSRTPQTAFELHRLVSEQMKVDRVSIYRILTAFRRAGLIHHVADKGFVICSHPGQEEDAHLYLICEDCDSVEEIGWPNGLRESIRRQVLMPAHFNGAGPVQITGLCARCR